MRPHRQLAVTFVWLAFIAHGLPDRPLDLQALQFASISEVYIPQERGSIPLSAKPSAPLGPKQRKSTPELGGAGLGSATTSAPVTCNAANASSQACYTATQQGRGK